MSVSDLKKLGLLRKESDWDAKHTRSFVPLIMWLVTAVSAIAGCVMLVLGRRSRHLDRAGGLQHRHGRIRPHEHRVGDRALQHDTDDATD